MEGVCGWIQRLVTAKAFAFGFSGFKDKGDERKEQNQAFLQGIPRARSPAEGDRGARSRAAGAQREDARAGVLQTAARCPARRPEAHRGYRGTAADEARALGAAREIIRVPA